MHAYLLAPCASCRAPNEVAIPVGDEREFVFCCHACQAHSRLTIDTSGEPLVVAEGLPEWAHPPPEPEPNMLAVPPKKRQKPAISAPKVVKSDDEDDVEDSDEGEPSTEPAPTPAPTPAPASVSASVPKAPAAKHKTKAPPPPKPKAPPPPPKQKAPAAKRPAVPAPAPAAGANGAAGGNGRGLPASQSRPHVQPPAPPAAARPAVVKHGSVVLAEFPDGYYYTGTVNEMEVTAAPPCRRACAPPRHHAGGRPPPHPPLPCAVPCAASQDGGSAAKCRFKVAWDDGDDPSWVDANRVCLAYRQPMPSEVIKGMQVLALSTGCAPAAPPAPRSRTALPH